MSRRQLRQLIGHAINVNGRAMGDFGKDAGIAAGAKEEGAVSMGSVGDGLFDEDATTQRRQGAGRQ